MHTEMFLLCFLILVILVILVANVWGRRVIRRNTEKEQADKERFSRWKCPTCDQEYGEEFEYIRYGKPTPLLGTDPVFTPGVIMNCQRCQFMNVFDSAGKHDPAFSSPIETEQPID